ncbi:MAG: LolA family protein [Sedimentisphaerales bacterium]
MKLNLKTVFLFIIFVIFCFKMTVGNPPTESQRGKLVDAVLKEPARSIDITLYKNIIEPQKPAEELRQMFEDFFDKAEGPKKNLSSADIESRDRDIRLNVERTLKEQETGRKVKERIRVDGYRQRIDQVFGRPKMVLLKGTPYEQIRPEIVLGPDTPYDETLVNLGDKRRGEYTSFTYFHTNKTARITNSKKSMWKRSDVLDFTSLASFLRPLLCGDKGTLLEPVFVPEPNKLDRFIETGFLSDTTQLTISSDPNTSGKRERIDIKSGDSQYGMVIICDNNDYSKIYYIEINNPITGKPLCVSKFDSFDTKGFPYSAEITEYGVDGQLKKREFYRIERVELNPAIPNEVFEFSPPKDYEVTKIDPNGTCRMIQEKGGIDGAMRTLLKATEEKDIGTLTELLGHEIWQVRLRSLQVLGRLLVQDANGLKGAAEVLKNDEKLEVRNEAQRIFNHLKSKGSIVK